MRCAGLLKARSMACIAPGFRVEWRGWDTKPHNSPFLARAWCLMDETTPQIVAAGRLPGRPGQSRNGRILFLRRPFARKFDESARRHGRICCQFTWRATELGFNHGLAGMFPVLQAGDLAYFWMQTSSRLPYELPAAILFCSEPSAARAERTGPTIRSSTMCDAVGRASVLELLRRGLRASNNGSCSRLPRRPVL